MSSLYLAGGRYVTSFKNRMKEVKMEKESLPACYSATITDATFLHASMYIYTKYLCNSL